MCKKLVEKTQIILVQKTLFCLSKRNYITAKSTKTIVYNTQWILQGCEIEVVFYTNFSAKCKINN